MIMGASVDDDQNGNDEPHADVNHGTAVTSASAKFKTNVVRHDAIATNSPEPNHYLDFSSRGQENNIDKIFLDALSEG